MVVVRKAAVSGYFYPGKEKELKEMIAGWATQPALRKQEAKGVILPHAGYEYSGKVAAQTIESSKLHDRMIILGPNHTGLGEAFSVMTHGSWQTPLGNVGMDSLLANKIIEKSKYLSEDASAHHSEHCIEVLLPFLQLSNPNLKIVPIVVSHATRSVYKEVAMDILKALKELKIENEVSIIASSDMTHYEPQESVLEKDHDVIEQILALDADNFLKRVEEKRVSMCGAIAAFILLEIVKGLGASRGELIQYQTSGDRTGDYRSVVGYAGIRIS